jgi:hypothetical protein
VLSPPKWGLRQGNLVLKGKIGKNLPFGYLFGALTRDSITNFGVSHEMVSKIGDSSPINLGGEMGIFAPEMAIIRDFHCFHYYAIDGDCA